MNCGFIIRTEHGGQIGSGHFYRCLALSLKLLKLGHDVKFVITDNEAIQILEKSNVPFTHLDNANENQCIRYCKETIKNNETLIVDLPFNNEQYSKEFEKLHKTAIIDDLGNKQIFSEMLFNGSMVEEYYKYQINENQTKLFLGPNFMILREEFSAFRQKIDITRGSVRKLLITFGGGDDLGLTSKIVPILTNLSYKVTAVLGRSNSEKNNLKKITEKSNDVVLMDNVNNMASLLAQQDLVISASGITSYELACLGIPTIFIPTGKFQIPTANAMEKEGFGLNYGFWDNDVKRFQNFLQEIDSFDRRKIMSKCGQKIVDGKGTSRVIENLINEKH